MDWDTASIANMAATSTYATWFPPAFTFLWRITDRVGTNPATMWLLQTALMLGGLYLLALALARGGKLALAVLVLISAVAPPFAYLFHEVSKDTFMAAALICLAGVGSYIKRNPPKNPSLRRCVWAVAITLTTLVLSTRYNAIFAVMPVFWLVVHTLTGRKAVGSVAISAGLLIVVFAGLSVFSHVVLKPLWRPTMSALISFDIAGITVRIAAPASRLAESKEFVEQISRCYRPEEWDTLVRNGCAAGYDGHVYHTYIAERQYVLGEWAAAIVKNPLAYARHRVAHFMCLLRVNCDDRQDIGIPLDAAKHNPRGSEVRTPALSIGYEQAARAFFWVFPPWIMFLSATAVTAWAGYVSLFRKTDEGATALVVFALGGSALVYTAAYLILGIANPFRYVYWPYEALWLAVVVAPMTAATHLRKRPLSAARAITTRHQRRPEATLTRPGA
jgi:hypothetical protein